MFFTVVLKNTGYLISNKEYMTINYKKLFSLFFANIIKTIFIVFISGAILLYEIGKYFGKGNNLFLTLGISTCLIVWISFAREITYSYEKHPSNYGNAINDRL